MFLGSWSPPLWCLKAKNSNSYCSSEGRYRVNPKKSSYLAKKVQLGFRGFPTNFWEVDHPLFDVWKQKNSNCYCSSEGRNRSNPKKSSYSAKKVRLGFRGFRAYFREVDRPLCDVWNKLIGAQVFGKAKIYKPTWTKTQFLIEFLDRTQKSTASRQKKFPRV